MNSFRGDLAGDGYYGLESAWERGCSAANTNVARGRGGSGADDWNHEGTSTPGFKNSMSAMENCGRAGTACERTWPEHAQVQSIDCESAGGRIGDTWGDEAGAVGRQWGRLDFEIPEELRRRLTSECPPTRFPYLLHIGNTNMITG